MALPPVTVALLGALLLPPAAGELGEVPLPEDAPVGLVAGELVLGLLLEPPLAPPELATGADAGADPEAMAGAGSEAGRARIAETRQAAT